MSDVKLRTCEMIEDRIYAVFKIDGVDRRYQVLNIAYHPDSMKASVKVSTSIDDEWQAFDIDLDDYERLVPLFK